MPQPPARTHHCGAGGSGIQGKPQQSTQLAGLRDNRAPHRRQVGRPVYMALAESRWRQAAMTWICHDPQRREWKFVFERRDC